MTKKDIVVGPPTDNECCLCCDKCWRERPGSANDACIRSCCSCPPMDSLCLTLDTGGTCPTVDGLEITLTQSVGVALCRDGNPTTRDGNVPCYRGIDPSLEDGIQGFENDYEKWGFEGIICAGLEIDGCDETTVGEKLKISLCCCDMADEHVTALHDSPADCNTCSYRLTFEWIRHIPDPPNVDKLCTCPNVAGIFGPEQIVPTCESSPPVNCTILYWDLTFEAGTCYNPPEDGVGENPFLLVYELAARSVAGGGWWNCDCCQNGIGVAANNVDLTVTIVEGTGPDGACSSP